jgi:enoyl-CoA hydratase
MNDAVLLDDRRDGILVITINRPEALNAINVDVREGLFTAWRRFEAEPTQRVAILTGAGNKAFCAGADLKEMAALQLTVPPADFFPVLGDNVHVTKPVIAAVNGIAFAGGWMFAQMCDLCVASETAKFGITESKVGRGFPWAAPMISMIPQRIMLEILLTGRPIDAKRAYEIGFVNHVVGADDLMSAALDLAASIVEGAPLTIAAAKEMVYATTEMGRSAALRTARHIFERVYRSSDAQEGPRAFREKRKPIWRGE